MTAWRSGLTSISFTNSGVEACHVLVSEDVVRENPGGGALPPPGGALIVCPDAPAPDPDDEGVRVLMVSPLPGWGGV